jgi:hypothetical protein
MQNKSCMYYQTGKYNDDTSLLFKKCKISTLLDVHDMSLSKLIYYILMATLSVPPYAFK